MADKKTEIEKLLEREFPEKTPQAIQMMLRAAEKYRGALLKRIGSTSKREDIIKIIEDFK